MDGSGLWHGGGARIGPNAILQLVPVLDRIEGRAIRDRVLADIALPPPDAGMWPETVCRAAHLAVYRDLSEMAPVILREAGQGTADYILAHRIPGPAKALIRMLPASLGARMLSAAIARHAWTFAGSGVFRIAARRPLRFEIVDNPLRPGGGVPCHWHAAVFTRLFQALVWPDARVEAVEDGRVSRFTLFPR